MELLQNFSIKLQTSFLQDEEPLQNVALLRKWGRVSSPLYCSSFEAVRKQE